MEKPVVVWPEKAMLEEVDRRTYTMMAGACCAGEHLLIVGFDGCGYHAAIYRTKGKAEAVRKGNRKSTASLVAAAGELFEQGGPAMEWCLRKLGPVDDAAQGCTGRKAPDWRERTYPDALYLDSYTTMGGVFCYEDWVLVVGHGESGCHAAVYLAERKPGEERQFYCRMSMKLVEAATELFDDTGAAMAWCLRRIGRLG